MINYLASSPGLFRTARLENADEAAAADARRADRKSAALSSSVAAASSMASSPVSEATGVDGTLASGIDAVIADGVATLSVGRASGPGLNAAATMPQWPSAFERRVSTVPGGGSGASVRSSTVRGASAVAALAASADVVRGGPTMMPGDGAESVDNVPGPKEYKRAADAALLPRAKLIDDSFRRLESAAGGTEGVTAASGTAAAVATEGSATTTGH
jgi:hypothetical protein